MWKILKDACGHGWLVAGRYIGSVYIIVEFSQHGCGDYGCKGHIGVAADVLDVEELNTGF